MLKICCLLVIVHTFALPAWGAEINPIKLANQKIQAQNYTRIDSMLVYQSDRLIAEYYYRGNDKNFQHRTHSTFKGITALLALIAIEQQLLAEDELLLPLLKRFASPDQASAKRERIRIKHLLNMTSGLDCDEAPTGSGPSREWGVDEGPKPVHYALNIPMAREPGEEWHYCSANSFLLAASISAALAGADREDIFQFAQQYLFTPLEISKSDYRLRYSPDGKFLMGQGNSNFKPRDLAKFGSLILNKGVWNGKRVLKEASILKIYSADKSINWSWVEQLKSHPPVNTHYSYQWYQTEFNIKGKTFNTIHSWGNGGQFIFAIPELDSVVVFTGSNQGNKRFLQQKQPFEIMWRFVLPALQH